MNRIATAAAALLLTGAAACSTAQPVEAASKPVYKGTVTICYAPSAKSDPYGQYLQNQWVTALPAAVKAAKVGKVKVVKERYPLTTCFGEVRLASAPTARAYGQRVPAAAAFGVYKYGEGRVMWESQIVMGDKVGAKSTAAQRQANLTAALKNAIPR